MGNLYFRFKQFTVNQDRCSMKVGTDGVLLGAWVNVSIATRKILDVGTGTGLIAMMLAQRTIGTNIDAIDIDLDAYEQAKANVADSSFSDRIQVFHSSLISYIQIKNTEYKYDLIVSNPPFFSASLKSPDLKRTTARHTVELSLEGLITDSLKMLTHKGLIALILPFNQRQELEQIVVRNSLFVTRLTAVIPVAGAKPKRLLVEISPEQNDSFSPDILTIELSRHQYTKEYIDLTKDFYLKM